MKRWRILIALALGVLLAAGCGQSPPVEVSTQWEHGIYYQIFVRSFYDSTGDGVGDLQGIINKLDYLNNGNPSRGKDLGITGLWLTPIHPSPTYHKYDVTDYYNIDPEYGTLEDFQELINQAHSRGIKVLMDLVVNHTSRRHPWFSEALLNPESKYRDYYIWATDDDNLWERGEWGQQLWYAAGGGHYYATFWSEMPDLNMDNPAVRKELVDIAKFWLDQGVDGFRLDAIKHIYPGSQSDKNNEWWDHFRTELEQVKPDIYLVGEVWDNYHVVAPYYKHLDSNFNFDLADRIIDSVFRGSNLGIASFVSRSHTEFAKHNPNFIDALFLTNHDQNRLFDRLGRNVDKNKVAASILLTLPGNPFIYYGEELGMLGRKPDEHIREPMQWYTDPSSGGQTNWIKPHHNLPGVTPSVEEQVKEKDSLYLHYRTMIHLRRSHPALLSGGFESIETGDRRLVGYIRTSPEGDLVVIHNISTQDLEIDMEEGTKLFFSSSSAASLRKGKLIVPALSTAIVQ